MNHTVEAAALRTFPLSASAMDASPDTRYEFNEFEESVLRKTHERLSFAALVLLILCALQILVGFTLRAPGSMSLPGVISGCMVAVMFRRAAKAFERVVCTEGEDMVHLMTAMSALNRVFGWMAGGYLITAISIVVGAVLLVASR